MSCPSSMFNFAFMSNTNIVIVGMPNFVGSVRNCRLSVRHYFSLCLFVCFSPCLLGCKLTILRRGGAAFHLQIARAVDHLFSHGRDCVKAYILYNLFKYIYLFDIHVFHMPDHQSTYNVFRPLVRNLPCILRLWAPHSFWRERISSGERRIALTQYLRIRSLWYIYILISCTIILQCFCKEK